MGHSVFYEGGLHASGSFVSGLSQYGSRIEIPQHHHGRVIVIDRRNLLRDCVSHVLRSFAPEIEIVSVASLDEVGDSNALLILFGHGCETSSLVKLRGFVAELKLRFPNAPTMAIMANDDPQCLLDVIDSGVSGVLPMNTNIRVALAAIELILAGGTFAPCNALANALHQEPGDAQMPRFVEMPEMTNLRPASTDFGAIPAIQLESTHKSAISEPAHIFTLREQQVLEHLKKGMQNKLIAYSLGIAESTVKVHLRNIMKKLHATNRTQVAFMTKDLHAEIALRIELDEADLLVPNTA